MDITFRDIGGNPYWVVDGVDVARSGNLSGLPLLAGAAREESKSGKVEESRSGKAEESKGQELEESKMLTAEGLAPVVAAARAYWAATDLSPLQRQQLAQAQFQIQDLSAAGALGLGGSQRVLIDDDGAGRGWDTGSGSRLTARGSPLSYDLLTVVTHELGHALGYTDLDPQWAPQSVMAGVLTPGVCRLEDVTPGSYAS